MKKIVFFAFKGEEMCFAHLLLNAIDLHEKGIEAKIVIEGEAVKLIEPLIEKENKMFKKALELGLIHSICKACSAKLGVLEYNEKSGIPINGDMNGHPPMHPFLDEGYEVITL